MVHLIEHVVDGEVPQGRVIVDDSRCHIQRKRSVLRRARRSVDSERNSLLRTLGFDKVKMSDCKGDQIAAHKSMHTREQRESEPTEGKIFGVK